MSNVLDQAQNFSGGPVSAARQRDRWARQEANATDDELRERYREAIADLEDRYPDIAEVPVGGAEAFARERGHGTGARSPVHEGRRRAGAGGPARTGKSTRKASDSGLGAGSAAGRGKATPVPGLTPGAQRTSSQRRAAKGRPTPRIDRAIRQTGIPTAVGASSSTALAALGGTVGLALLYLVLSSAETPGSGMAAFPSLVDGIVRSLHRFLSLGDVFPSNQASSAIPPGMIEGSGGKLRPEGPAGAYNTRVKAGVVAGPPTPPQTLGRYGQQSRRQKARHR